MHIPIWYVKLARGVNETNMQINLYMKDDGGERDCSLKNNTEGASDWNCQSTTKLSGQRIASTTSPLKNRLTGKRL